MVCEDGIVSRLSLGYSLELELSASGLVGLSVAMGKVCSALKAGFMYLRLLKVDLGPVVYPGIPVWAYSSSSLIVMDFCLSLVPPDEGIRIASIRCPG
jgi:hypothetical protein